VSPTALASHSRERQGKRGNHGSRDEHFADNHLTLREIARQYLEKGKHLANYNPPLINIFAQTGTPGRLFR
jgi:hypothetical protein